MDEEKVLDTNWFVGDIEEYTCPICLGILRNAMQAIVDAQCGHHFCEVCAKDIFKREGVPCPVCRVKVKKSNLHPDVHFRRKISELRVRCHVDPDRCNATDQFGNGEWWEQHEKVCIANTDPCVACSQRVLKSAMGAHLAECKELEINCPFACKHTCKRKDMQVHEEICKLTRGPDTVALCRFAALGCRFEAKRSAVKDVETHMKVEAAKHLGMLLGEAEEREEIQWMEYVLLSKGRHNSKKFITMDGTEVWFSIFPATDPIDEGYYSFFTKVSQQRFLNYKAEAFIVKPDASLELEVSCDAQSRERLKPCAGRGWIRFLKVEPGTLVKLVVSEIKVTHSQQNALQPVPSLQHVASLVKELQDSRQQLKDVQQMLNDVQQQQTQQQQKQEQQQQEIKDLLQELKELKAEDNSRKRRKSERTESHLKAVSKRSRHRVMNDINLILRVMHQAALFEYHESER
eukprot:g3874.t1